MQTWMTIEQAADALGVSARTVQRRVAANDLQSRSGDGNRREVLVDDTPRDDRRSTVGELGEVVLEQHDRALALAEHASNVGQLSVERIAQEAQAARRMVGIVGVILAVTLTLGVGGGLWAAWKIGGSEVRLESAERARADVEAHADTLAGQLTDARRDADAARDAALQADARAGQLADTLADARAQLQAERERAAALAAQLISDAKRPPVDVDGGL